MNPNELKNLLEIVDSMEEEQVIVILATIANEKNIKTYITKNTPIKMQVIDLDEEKYGRIVKNLGKFNFIKTSNEHN